MALLDPGEQSAPTYLAMSQVDAVAYRARWSDLEPTEGSLTTTHLDLVLSQAAAAGKPVTVHIGVSSGAAPSWLATKGIPTYSATTPRGTTTEYVPWDSTFLAAYSAFVARLGQHLDGNATVNHVSVGAPISEMTIVGCMNGMLGSTPYQRAAYLGAWRTTIDAVEAAFPNVGVFVSLPLSFVCAGDGDGDAFAADLQSSLATTTSWFAADLRADGSVRAGQLPPGATIGFQPTWYVTGDTTNKVGGSIQQMVCAGWNAGSRYFELYKQDLSSGSQDLTAALAAARTGSGC